MKPTHIEHPADWKGAELDYTKQALRILSSDDVAQIDAALAHMQEIEGLDFCDVTQKTFPLGSFGDSLRDMRNELRTGLGFVLMRGLPRERYTSDQMAWIYFGIGAYLGHSMPQSYHGELLGHVMDVSDVEKDARAYHSDGHLAMHTDVDDIVALMCLRTSLSGGASRIASAVAIHNELARTRPDLLEILYRGFHMRRMDRDAAAGTGRVVSEEPLPVFKVQDGEITCFMVGGYVRRAEMAGDISLSELEREALDEFERLAMSPEFYLDMDFADGDVQFLNNRVMLHGRTEFVNIPAFDKRRNLLRLWLRVPDWTVFPESQILHTDEDRKLWSRHRTRLQELPSRYLAYLDHLKATADGQVA
ncbi:TauD/TfdA family dioxygenase [Actibacterium sp.]|jgi:hypothetical protein|uniref:TauD/TfdA family dioxygenase n=1 Tax=Actibacterium sp. TaxID=1872125 RepID=UPI00257C5C35|nr:TauD/TfdA family dioxygenase [Actibacterium sp.]|tara:strand:- start:11230 stop:12315 length:1086 start_codon:yes stop_codon:yes gene_type:complete